MKNGDMPAMPQANVDNLCQMSGLPKPLHMGLTKREQFAMAAMQGILSSEYYGDFCGADISIGSYEQRAAKSAIAHADALLAALEKAEGE